MDARGLVLMERENGVLTWELGSYEVDSGLEYVFKAYVENGIANLFLTTEGDVDDDEYNAIYDEYNMEAIEDMGCEIEEIEDEYNPVWCVRFRYEDEHEAVEGIINDIIGFHEDELKRVYQAIK